MSEPTRELAAQPPFKELPKEVREAAHGIVRLFAARGINEEVQESIAYRIYGVIRSVESSTMQAEGLLWIEALKRHPSAASYTRTILVAEFAARVEQACYEKAAQANCAYCQDKSGKWLPVNEFGWHWSVAGSKWDSRCNSMHIRALAGGREAPILECSCKGRLRNPKVFQADDDCPIHGSREAPCPDCERAMKHAYSDATTPGFFYDKCEKHRVGREAMERHDAEIRRLIAKWREQAGPILNEHAGHMAITLQKCADELEAKLKEAGQ